MTRLPLLSALKSEFKEYCMGFFIRRLEGFLHIIHMLLFVYN